VPSAANGKALKYGQKRRKYVTMQGSTRNDTRCEAQSDNMFVFFKFNERNKIPFHIPLINSVAAEQTNDIRGLICKQNLEVTHRRHIANIQHTKRFLTKLASVFMIFALRTSHI
jgi:hypothetical protein